MTILPRFKLIKCPSQDIYRSSFRWRGDFPILPLHIVVAALCVLTVLYQDNVSPSLDKLTAEDEQDRVAARSHAVPCFFVVLSTATHPIC
jgi:hypothetical protein